MGQRNFKLFFLLGILAILPTGFNCKPVQVRSAEDSTSEQPARCRISKPKLDHSHSCDDNDKDIKYFLHQSYHKGCKKFSLCPNDITRIESEEDLSNLNYFPDYESCQKECMTHITCPEPDLLAESHAEIHSDNGLRGWGRKVVYTCESGYSFAQNARRYTRTCQKDTTWSGMEPVCIKQCGKPPSVNHSDISPSPNAYESYPQDFSFHYTCHVGYHIQGSQQVTCGAEGRWTVPPQCVCDVPGTNGHCPTCPEPDMMENMVISAPSRSLGATSTYTCSDGFILIGNSSRTCIEEDDVGVWSGTSPVCERNKLIHDVAIMFGDTNITNGEVTLEVGTTNVVIMTITNMPALFNTSRWTFSKSSGQTDLPHSVHVDDTGLVLTFDKIFASKEQEGNYTITFGNCSVSFSLNVIKMDPRIAPSFVSNLRSMTVPLNGAVTLRCYSTGVPAPHLTWYHNDQHITNSAKHTLSFINSTGLAIGFLTIFTVEIDDEGIYRCLATNPKGSVFSDPANLTVEAPTSAPQDSGSPGLRPVKRSVQTSSVASICSQSADTVLLRGSVRKTVHSPSPLETYRVHIKHVLRSAVAGAGIDSLKSIQTIVTNDGLSSSGERLLTNTDYLIQGTLVHKTLLVSPANVHRFTPELAKHLASC